MSTLDATTLHVRQEGGVLFVDIDAPPMNLIGPELVRDLVALIQHAEGDNAVQVLVFSSADPDYFIPHVDITQISEYRAEAAKLTGEASIGLLFHHLSSSRLVTIAQITGRVRGAGSEFVLACDMRFGARESAIFSQPEAGFGLIPGGGGVQHLTRLMGRGRALEVMLGARTTTPSSPNATAGSTARSPPPSSTPSSAPWRTASPRSPPPAAPPSRTGSTRSRSLAPRTSAATPISSGRERATRRRRAASRPRSRTASRPARRSSTWPGCWARSKRLPVLDRAGALEVFRQDRFDVQVQRDPRTWSTASSSASTPT